PPSLPSAATTSAPLFKVTGSTASSSRADSARERRPSVIWHGRFRRSSSVARVTAYGQSGVTTASQPEWLPSISCSPAIPQSPLSVPTAPHRLDATRATWRHWRPPTSRLSRPSTEGGHQTAHTTPPFAYSIHGLP